MTTDQLWSIKRAFLAGATWAVSYAHDQTKAGLDKALAVFLAREQAAEWEAREKARAQNGGEGRGHADL